MSLVKLSESMSRESAGCDPEAGNSIRLPSPESTSPAKEKPEYLRSVQTMEDSRVNISEIGRKAQKIAKERLSLKSGNSGHSNRAKLEDDAIKLSREAIERIGQPDEIPSGNRTSKLMDALAKSIDDQLDSSSSKQMTSKKRLKKKYEWQPKTQAGQFHRGRDVIGSVRVTKTLVRVPKNEQNKPKSNGSKKIMKLRNRAGKKLGNSPTEGVEVFGVRTRATGASQSLDVLGAKVLQRGDSFRTFRRLDNKPLLKYATLHKRDVGNYKETAMELKKNALAAGESPRAIREALRLLKDRNGASRANPS